MLALDVRFVDIDPFQWRRISFFQHLVKPSSLRAHILCHRNEPINVLGPDGEYLSINREISCKEGMAASLFQRYSYLDEVWVYEFESLIQYVRDISEDIMDLDGDSYYRFCEQRWQSDGGIQRFARSQEKPTISVPDFLEYLEAHNPTQYHLCIGVYDKKEIYFSLIVRVLDGKVKVVSTFDYVENLGMHIPAYGDHASFARHFATVVDTPCEVLFVQKDILRSALQADDIPGALITAIWAGDVHMNSDHGHLVRGYLERLQTISSICPDDAVRP
jgi:hypothetical protein